MTIYIITLCRPHCSQIGCWLALFLSFFRALVESPSACWCNTSVSIALALSKLATEQEWKVPRTLLVPWLAGPWLACLEGKPSSTSKQKQKKKAKTNWISDSAHSVSIVVPPSNQGASSIIKFDTLPVPSVLQDERESDETDAKVSTQSDRHHTIDCSYAYWFVKSFIIGYIYWGLWIQPSKTFCSW